MNVYIETFGCTANKSDESIIRGILSQDHHAFVDTIAEADILILLTCTVIDTTEQRMLSRIKTLQKTKKPLIVTGCMIPLQQEKIRILAPDATLVPPQYIYCISDILQKKEPSYILRNKTLLPKQFTGVIAPIAIAEGCFSSCSYCITHLARGALRSFPRDEIVSDVQSALNQGCREIQLTAQDTASFGLDTGDNLDRLIKDVTTLPGDFRVRLGMMNPSEVQKKFTTILPIFSYPKLYNFLHLPIQSGDNILLSKMNRLYTVEDFLLIIQRFRDRYPLLTLSTDVIIGFPTETEAQFDHTVTLLKTIKPDIINITRYSARPFTQAKTMRGRIPTEIVKKRSTYLTTLCKKLTEEKNKQHKGRQYTILITKKGKQNTFVGRTDNYKPVVIQEQVTLGKFYTAEIVDAASTHLFGKLI